MNNSIKKVTFLSLVLIVALISFYFTNQDKNQRGVAPIEDSPKRIVSNLKISLSHQVSVQHKYGQFIGVLDNALYWFPNEKENQKVYKYSLDDYSLTEVLDLKSYHKEGENYYFYLNSQENSLSVLLRLGRKKLNYNFSKENSFSKDSLSQKSIFEGLVCSSSEVILRIADHTEKITENKTVRKSYLTKMEAKTNKVLATNFSVFKAENDGGLEEDGEMVYNQGKFYYTCAFTNRFFCLDSNLNTLYEAKTIGVGSIQPRVSEMSYGGGAFAYTHSVPVVLANIKFRVQGEKLYIHSGLSTGQEKGELKNVHVIDVYHSHNGQYIHSIYVDKPRKEEKYMTDFLLHENKLIVLYSDHISIYQIN